MAKMEPVSTGCKEDIPHRLYMDDPGISWRSGSKPNYDLVNRKFLSERKRRHRAGSLEKLIEDAVKTWEMEAAHKVDIRVTYLALPAFYI